MQVRQIPIDDINPYSNNPRKNDSAVDFVANSIREFGFKVPLVIDSAGTIVTGHTRYKAAKQLGMTELPCIVADDLTREQVKAYRLADNKVAEIAEWDFELLEAELEDIQDSGADIDMAGLGFEISADELQRSCVEDDFEATAPANPTAKLGDVWQLGRHRLMCGDSTKPEDIKTLMKDDKAAVALTDPPYGIGIVSGSKTVGGGYTRFQKNNRPEQWGGWVSATEYMHIIGDDTTDTARNSYSLMAEHSENQIIFGGNYFTDFLQPSSCWVIWDKENTGNFADVEMAWTSFSRAAKLYRWMWNGLARKGDRKTEGVKRVHPTQKPVGLLGEILDDFTDKDDIVLDLFGGSGSTLIACEQLGRVCYMMELAPQYIDVIVQRWENYTGQKAKRIIKGAAND